MSGLATEQAKAEPASAPLGIYVHVPFCASTCDFCAFYQNSRPRTSGKVPRWIEREAALVRLAAAGDDGVLGRRHARAAGAARSRHGWRRSFARVAAAAPAEWTVELAPASVTAERLAVLRDAGVTRVSMGVQSFQPELLDALGRQHTREQIYRAYERVRAADFASVNLDLMFALPGQTAAEWAADVREAVSLAPDHCRPIA